MSKYLLEYSADIVNSPILSKTVIDTGVLINVLRADIEYDTATIIVDIPTDEKKVIEKFKEFGVSVKKLDEIIMRDTESCIDCGACISICPSGAIYFKDDWSIEVRSEECIQCGACVLACPMKAMSIQEI